MTWICSYGVVNCTICQRSRETIKAMMPTLPDSVVDKAVEEQNINLHQEIDEISINITTEGEPKIEVKGKPVYKKPYEYKSPEGAAQIGIDNPNNPFFTRTSNNTKPWDLEKERVDFINRELGEFEISLNEGDLPPMWIRSSQFIGESIIDNPYGFPRYQNPPPSPYRTIGIHKESEVQKPNKLVPTSRLLKDLNTNKEEEFYRRQGIKTYKSSDGKNTMIIDRKSEIKFQ